MSTHEFIRNIKVLAVLISLTVGASYAQAAFVGPPGVAPNCPTGQPGCDAPLNVGKANQVKGGLVGEGAIWSKGAIGTDGGGIFGDSVKIGNTAVPNTKAALDIESTTKGILPPRLTTAQRNAITGSLLAAEKAALDGLTIYNTDSTVNGLERFDGTNWGPAVSVTAAAGVDGPSFFARKSANLNGSAGAAWSTYNYVFDTIVGPNGNTDPCAPTAGNCPRGADGRAWGFDTTTGVFKPSVPGRYILTVAVQPQVYNSAGYSQLNLLKNGGSIANTYGYDNGIEYRTDSISVVVDANGTTDYFSVQVQVYNSTVIWSGSSYSYFSGSRVGNPVTVNQTVNNTTIDNTVTIDAPANMVGFFAQTSCPSGWSQYTQANGRYLVAVTNPANGAGNLTQGLPLSDGENRNIPGPHNHNTNIDHYHATYMPSHNHNLFGTYTMHYVGGSAGFGSRDQNGWGTAWSYTEYAPQINYNTSYLSSSGGQAYLRTTESQNSSSLNTNAPYVGLLACKKN